jgi:diacylglycerol kinase (ATP)
MMGLYRSFVYALRGLIHAVRSERNLKIHLLATVLVVAALIYFPVERWEIVAALTCIGVIWAAEMLNTAIEHLSDFVHPDHHEKIGRVKDIAAGGVMLMALIAVVIAVVVFGKHVQALF